MVTLRDFIKAKVPHDDPNSNLTFNTWFLSVMYSIRYLWKSLWREGLIYGFCTREAAVELLKRPEYPVGTVLLRPSLSSVDSKNSNQARAALMCVLKHIEPAETDPSQECTKYLALEYDTLQKGGLYRTIMGIVYKDQRVAKFLRGYNSLERIEVLLGKAFGARMEKHKDYPQNNLIERVQHLTITDKRPTDVDRRKLDAGSCSHEESKRKKTVQQGSSASGSEEDFFCHSQVSSIRQSESVIPHPDEGQRSSPTAGKKRSKKTLNKDQRLSGSMRSAVTSPAREDRQKKNANEKTLAFGKNSVNVTNIQELPRTYTLHPEVGSKTNVDSTPGSSPTSDSGCSSISPDAFLRTDLQEVIRFDQTANVPHQINGLFSGNPILTTESAMPQFSSTRTNHTRSGTKSQNQPNGLQGDRIQSRSSLPRSDKDDSVFVSSLPTVLWDSISSAETKPRGRKNRGKNVSGKAPRFLSTEKGLTEIKPSISTQLTFDPPTMRWGQVQVDDSYELRHLAQCSDEVLLQLQEAVIPNTNIATLLDPSLAEEQTFSKLEDQVSTNPHDSGYSDTRSLIDDVFSLMENHPFQNGPDDVLLTQKNHLL